jgi:tRNA(Ile)-lysidine synthase
MPTTYIVAVSGGVDSAVLLHILHHKYLTSRVAPWKCVVAHFDHGIRDDSGDDRLFVQGLARKYGLPFVFDEGGLGAGASEAAAREARYSFLRRVRSAAGAEAIAMAHHEDDVLETAILNLLRGTGRKGLSSLQSTPEIYRPLLGVPKANLIAYAQQHNLAWREDSTNTDTNYLRNYIRLRLLPRFDAPARQRLRELIDAARLTNTELDTLLAEQLRLQPGNHGRQLDRRWFISLPHAVAREVMAAWLRSNGITSFSRQSIERMVAHAKTLPPGKRIDVVAGHGIIVKADVLALTIDER